MFALPTNITSAQSIVPNDTPAMVTNILFTSIALLSGLSHRLPPRQIHSDQPTMVDIRVGEGKLIEEGDQVTVQYRVCDSTKKELANSIKRGMPFTLAFGGRNSDPLVSVVLAGMHVGGSRYTVLSADSLPTGVGSIVPPKTDLTIWVHVIAAQSIKSGKVELPNAERAQGAVEVPRIAAHHGSART